MSEPVLLILVAECLIPQSLREPLETTDDDLSEKGMRVVGWRIKDAGPQLVTLYLSIDGISEKWSKPVKGLYRLWLSKFIVTLT